MMMSGVTPRTGKHTQSQSHSSRPHSQAGGFSGSLTPGMGPGYLERGVDRPGCVGERGSVRVKDRENVIFICLIVLFYISLNYIEYSFQSLIFWDNGCHPFMQIKHN